MKQIISLLSIVLLSSYCFAAAKPRNPASEIPAAVNGLASKLAKEVRTRISVYNVSAAEANGCSDEGTHYNIKVQVKKYVRAADKQGNPTIKSTWETAREVDTDASGTQMEVCLE
ncbi:MAG: hypothetical protein H7328_05625 [Bdellovibrio sp.]|nr:hypothetical protein [Bdellovibrio sp.]